MFTPSSPGERQVLSAVKTLRVKLRPGAGDWLDGAAREVNLVWNHVNELCAKAARPYYGPPKWLTGFDVVKLLAGTSKELEYLPASTIERIAIDQANRRRQTKRSCLAWRKSGGSKRSLGWVPFRDGQVRVKDGAAVFAGRRFRIFDSYGLAGLDLRGGSFAQNALGEWFLNIVVRVAVPATGLPAKAVGIDLGLKDIATTSEGDTLPAGRWYRRAERKIAQAQRRGHKRQAKRFQRDAANRRKDALHKFSTRLVRDCGAIYIGDVSSTRLAKTRMAKSVLDSGWGMLKTMLQYKGHQAGRIVEVVNERFTTQACSACGSLTGPKGRTGLVVREWTCGDCGTSHSRDVNAARNILAAGLGRPSAGTPRVAKNEPSLAALSTTQPKEGA
jgi:IS605 OrfB family transposase